MTKTAPNLDAKFKFFETNPDNHEVWVGNIATIDNNPNLPSSPELKNGIIRSMTGDETDLTDLIIYLDGNH